MKHLRFIPLIAVIAFLMACNQDRIKQLEEENAQLKVNSTQKDSSLEDMLASFNQIQENLDEIKKREGLIRVRASEEVTEDLAGNINKDIAQISELMQKNEALIKGLNKKLAQSGRKNSEFSKMVENLNEQLLGKNQEIAQLNKQLQEKQVKIGQLYFSIDSLNFSNRQKEIQLEDKIDQLNVAYYAYGTFKELKEKNVLTKEGGFLGLGKNEELKNDFNKEYFSKIDIREQKSFLIYAEKAELITNHPSGSYEFKGKEGKVDSLVITNVEDFWRSSRYMVIVVD
jgi:chromosome segregation ATPase